MRAALKKLALLTLPALVVCLLIAELFFRFVVPAAQIPFAAFDREFRMLRHDVAGPRDGFFTIGPFAESGGHWHINDEGWNSAIQYAKARDRSRPLVAIIGDSFVVALHVEPSKSFGGVLRTKLGAQADVYTFGVSGTPLSGYLQTARYVSRTFQPDVLVVNVVDNDFDESLRTLIPAPEFLQYVPDGDGVREQQPTAYTPSPTRRQLSHSALARYLMLNCRVRGALRRKAIAVPDRPLIAAMIRQVVHSFRAENPNTRIIFMLDAPRMDMYRGTLAQSRLLWPMAQLRDAAATNGCETLDLTPAFVSEWSSHHEMLNFKSDYHWNETAHRIAAEQLYRQLR